MAMKGSTVRGTPVHHVTQGSRGDGQNAGRPAGMSQTVHEQYHADQRGYQTNPRSGTPYQSEDGNPPNARREVLRSTSAVSSDHGDQNNPRSNGPGVMLDDGANEYQRGYMPTGEATLDSPVPRHAAMFDTASIPVEDRAHMGKGRGQPEQANPDLLEIGGVLSRGMVGTSKPGRPETELMEDDEEGLHGPDTGHMRPEGE